MWWPGKIVKNILGESCPEKDNESEDKLDVRRDGKGFFI